MLRFCTSAPALKRVEASHTERIACTAPELSAGRFLVSEIGEVLREHDSLQNCKRWFDSTRPCHLRSKTARQAITPNTSERHGTGPRPDQRRMELKFRGGTIFAVHMRLRDAVRHPRLFNDRMPAGRVRCRIERFRRWCGPTLWQVLCDYEMKHRQPPEDVERWRIGTH